MGDDGNGNTNGGGTTPETTSYEDMRRYVDYGSNLTSKIYLSKLDGSDVEVQITANSMSVKGGERDFEKKDYIGSYYSMVGKPPTLREISLERDSDETALDLLEMLDGEAETKSSGEDSGYYYEITGGGEQKYYRFVYEVETLNAKTGKIIQKRWIYKNAMCSATDIEFPADDAISFNITAKCGHTDYKFQITKDKESAPLPDLEAYESGEEEVEPIE